MKQKFQVGDIVRVKRGECKGQLAEVTKVFKGKNQFNDRCKYGVRLHNSCGWFVGWSFDFDKALAPITTKDLKRYGLVPTYEYSTSIDLMTVQRFQYQPSKNKKSKIIGYLGVRLYTKRNDQNEIVQTECIIQFDRNLCTNQYRKSELIKCSHLCFNIYSTQELKKVMDFIQNI